MIYIIYRTCEKFFSINGNRPLWCNDRNIKNKCLRSLASGLIKDEFKFIVIGDALSKETEEKILSIVPEADIRNFKDGLGNQKSLFQSYCAADNLTNDGDIVFFCEDDYLFTPNWLSNMKYFFEKIGCKFKYSFYHPTDYPDQYREDRSRRSFIYLNPRGGWFREVDSTTCTKACSVATYKKYSSLMKDCAIRKKIGYDSNANAVYNEVGADDGRLSEIFGHKNTNGYINLTQEAVCFSPIPGDAGHMHEGVMSFFINWKNIYDNA